MALKNQELNALKELFEQKKDNFIKAITHHAACINNVKKLSVVERQLKAGSLNAFNQMDSKLLAADKRIIEANNHLRNCKSVGSFDLYVRMFNIKNIDMDLQGSYRTYETFHNICKKRGWVGAEILNSFEQTNFILVNLIKDSVEQLDLCIDFIEKTLQNEKEQTQK